MSSISALSPQPPVAKPEPRAEAPPQPKAPERRDDDKAAEKVTAAKPTGSGRVVDIRA